VFLIEKIYRVCSGQKKHLSLSFMDVAKLGVKV
jgi:hypothetical protein